MFGFLAFMDKAALWLMQDTIQRVCDNPNTNNRVAKYLRLFTKPAAPGGLSPAAIFNALAAQHDERLRQKVSGCKMLTAVGSVPHGVCKWNRPTRDVCAN